MTNLVNPFISFPVVCCAPLVAGGWVEIGRTTLACTGDCITVSCLPYHKQYQVVGYIIACGNARVRGRFNCDSCTNYAYRVSRCDGVDITTATNQGQFGIDTTVCRTNNGFFIFTTDNSGDCKLGINHFVSEETAGASNPPERCEVVNKWNVTDPITSITIHNPTACTSFLACSQAVVLGSCNPDQCMNFWELLTTATVDECMCPVTALTTCTFTTKKYLKVEIYSSQCTNAAWNWQVGNTTLDTGCNYSTNYSRNNLQATLCCSSVMLFDISSCVENGHGEWYGINIAGEEKLLNGHASHITSFGAATPPQRTEYASKWTNTCDQINIVGVLRTSGCGTMDKGYIKVWGSN